MTERPILIVEDDEGLRLTLAENLADEGYDVDTAANGAEMEAALAANSYALILLDIMLPDTDGYTLCRKLREQGDRSTMVLMLTARTLEEDLVKGFEAGADDYLAKPYRLRELFMRVAALLRRRDPQVAHKLAFGSFTLDPEARSVTGAEGLAIDFTRTEFDLLALFLARQGQALTRDTILDLVWGEEVAVDHRTIDNFVSSIKRKLGWTPEQSYRIATIRGVGYRFELEE